MYMLAFLVMAALLEIGGDAAIRDGLTRPAWTTVLLGIALLATYGFVVNTNRTIDFGRLRGLYIVVFFLTSQVIAAVVFGERPPPALLIGGALVTAGGVVILLGVQR
jgi:small multidrug resistance family-3 protein